MFQPAEASAKTKALAIELKSSNLPDGRITCAVMATGNRSDLGMRSVTHPLRPSVSSPLSLWDANPYSWFFFVLF
jgi:hypothetical protein